MKEEEEQESSRLDDIKYSEIYLVGCFLTLCRYYTSIFLGSLAIIAAFAFLFLVPFVLDPAISTLYHKFLDDPVHCKERLQDEDNEFFFSLSPRKIHEMCSNVGELL